MQQRSTGELLRFVPPSEDFMRRAAEKTFTFNRKKFTRLPLQDMMETTYTGEIQKHIQVSVKWVSYNFGFSSSNWFIAQTWDFCDQLRPSTSRLCCWFIYTRTAASSTDDAAVATFQQSYLFRALPTGLLSPATVSLQGLQVENVHRTRRGRCGHHLHQRCRL